MKQVLIAEGLVSSLSASPRLIGARCQRCDARCGSEDLQAIELPARGRLWTWTSQEFLPKSPPYTGGESKETFKSWYVGYVDLDGLHVEGRLVGFEERTPEIGEEVELTLIPFGIDGNGDEVMIYGFQPVGLVEEN